MPGFTEHGFVYPLDTDPIADLPRLIAELAGQVAKIGARRQNLVFVDIPRNAHSETYNVVFPDPFPDGTPVKVLTTIRQGFNGTANWLCGVHEETHLGFRLTVSHRAFATDANVRRVEVFTDAVAY